MTECTPSFRAFAIGVSLLSGLIFGLLPALRGARRIGLILAGVGLYGQLTFAASRRTREIGIRVAMGAPRAELLRMMIGDGLSLAAGGILLGTLIAIPASGLIVRWLYDVNPYDVTAFAAIAAVLLAVSFLASYLPARRAAAVHPLVALKDGN